MLAFTSAESTVEMLLNSASGLKWTSWMSTCPAVQYNSLLKAFLSQVLLTLRFEPNLNAFPTEAELIFNILMMSPLSLPPGQSYHSLEGRLKVVIHPQSQQLQVGENLQLECGAVGRPIPRYQWHRNGVPVPSATKRKLLVRKLLF